MWEWLLSTNATKAELWGGVICSLLQSTHANLYVFNFVRFLSVDELTGNSCAHIAYSVMGWFSELGRNDLLGEIFTKFVQAFCSV